VEKDEKENEKAKSVSVVEDNSMMDLQIRHNTKYRRVLYFKK